MVVQGGLSKDSRWFSLCYYPNHPAGTARRPKTFLWGIQRSDIAAFGSKAEAFQVELLM